MRVTAAVKPELSLHMTSRLLWCFTQHVRDCFHFTTIAKGWFLALHRQAFPKWFAVVAGMPDAVLCHNAQGLRAPGRGVAVSTRLGLRGGTVCRLWSTAHALCGTKNQRLQQWNGTSWKGTNEQPPKWVGFVPLWGQGCLSSKSRLCMLSAFPSSSFLIFSRFSPSPSKRAP